MLNYNLSRMQHTIELGTMTEDDFSPEPNAEKTFTPAMKLRCGSYIITSRSYAGVLLGQQETETVNVVVRHNKNILNHDRARYMGTVYRVASVQTDERPNAFDILTLTTKEKSENNNAEESM